MHFPHTLDSFVLLDLDSNFSRLLTVSKAASYGPLGPITWYTARLSAGVKLPWPTQNGIRTPFVSFFERLSPFEGGFPVNQKNKPCLEMINGHTSLWVSSVMTFFCRRTKQLNLWPLKDLGSYLAIVSKTFWPREASIALSLILEKKATAPYLVQCLPFCAVYLGPYQRRAPHTNKSNWPSVAQKWGTLYWKIRLNCSDAV